MLPSGQEICMVNAYKMETLTLYPLGYTHGYIVLLYHNNVSKFELPSYTTYPYGYPCNLGISSCAGVHGRS